MRGQGCLVWLLVGIGMLVWIWAMASWPGWWILGAIPAAFGLWILARVLERWADRLERKDRR